MTDITTARRRGLGEAASEWIGRTQAQLSDRVHASGDQRARALGWEITRGTGRYGFGDRTYHDRRLTGRRLRMVRPGQPRPVVRHPLAELCIPSSQAAAGQHLR